MQIRKSKWHRHQHTLFFFIIQGKKRQTTSSSSNASDERVKLDCANRKWAFKSWHQIIHWNQISLLEITGEVFLSPFFIKIKCDIPYIGRTNFSFQLTQNNCFWIIKRSLHPRKLSAINLSWIKSLLSEQSKRIGETCNWRFDISQTQNQQMLSLNQ